MNRLLSVVLALGLAANGFWMLFSPASWYVGVPGVTETGPLNVHFVRDIGCAFFVASMGLGWLAIARDRGGRPAALAAAVFLGLHALVHIADCVTGREHAHRLIQELPTVFLPPLLILWLARRPLAAVRNRLPLLARRSHGLLARIAGRRLDAFERDFGYDTTYLREIADASGGAFLRFALFSVFAGHREEVPADAWFAAKIASTLAEDCGPCTQLVVQMAEKANVSAQTLRAILARDMDSMGPDAALALSFSNAVLARDVAMADRLREQVLARWGRRALISLAFAVASSRVYPNLKYALGHGRACTRVSVGGEDTLVARSGHA